MSEETYIRGEGGWWRKTFGGPTTDDNTLFSSAKAKIVDLISEGEISGLINGKKSVFINNTPLEDGTGEDNFSGVVFTERFGTNDQAYIEGHEGVETSTAVNIQVTKETFADGQARPGPCTVTIPSPSNLDAVRVSIYIPALVNSDNKKNDVHGDSVSFKLEIDDGSYTWESLVEETISGKCTQRFDKSYRLEIPESFKDANFSTLRIKMTRTSADNYPVEDKIGNDIYFGAYTTIVDNKLTYPNSALVGLQLNAEQFNAIPTRGYEIKGVKIKVPSNYTAYEIGHCSIGGNRRKDTCEAASVLIDDVPTSGVWSGTAVGTTLYDGSWDGTFTTAWTCNPAWIFYDLCTEERYGLGKWLDASQIDKWKLYEIARYCDAVDNDGKFVGVDSGWGPSSNPHKEARFTCNLYLQSAEEAYKVLNDIAAIFRGLLYWQEGMIVPIQDAPKDPVMNFGDANVIDGQFTYEGSSRKQRHNVALVTWNNPEDLYKQNTEYVEDADAIVAANTQIFSKSVRALGCTSQSQARRIGKWLLYSEKFESEVCSFSTGMEGVGVRPGDLIKIADSARAGVRYGGRVAPGSTVNMIQLDSSTPVVSGKTYKLSLLNAEKACVREGVKQTTVSSTTTAAAADKLIDTTQSFTSSIIGTTITRTSNNGTATVSAVDSNTQLTLSSDLMVGNEVAYTYQITGEEVCVNAHIDNEWKPYTWIEQRETTSVTTTESVTQLGIPSGTPFTNVPTTTYMWILEEMGSVEAQDFRVLSVRESAPNTYEISALKYHGAKYDLIENNIEFSAKSTSSLPDPSGEVPQPRDLLITEELYNDSRDTIKNRATFSWKQPYTWGTAVLYPYVASYYVEWRRTAPTITNWMSLGETTSTSVTIDDAPAGNLEFRVKTRRVF